MVEVVIKEDLTPGGECSARRQRVVIFIYFPLGKYRRLGLSGGGLLGALALLLSSVLGVSWHVGKRVGAMKGGVVASKWVLQQ